MKTADNQTEVLENVSHWYRTEGFFKRLANYGFEEMKKYFKGDSVLEIGPADGHQTGLLLKEFKRVDCVEASSAYCSILRKQFKNKVTVHESFIEQANIKDTFDTIVCAHLLEHIPDPVLALKKIKSFMHRDSQLIIIVPNAHAIHRLVAVEMGMLTHIKELNLLDKKLGHFRVYDKDDLTTDIYKGGLKISHVGGVFLKVLSNSQLEKWDMKLLDGFYRAGRHVPDLCADLLFVCNK